MSGKKKKSKIASASFNVGGRINDEQCEAFIEALSKHELNILGVIGGAETIKAGFETEVKVELPISGDEADMDAMSGCSQLVCHAIKAAGLDPGMVHLNIQGYSSIVYDAD